MRYQRPEPRERTAYHEAGHAVVGYLLGWQVSYMSIQANTSYHGYTAFIEPRPPHRHAILLGIVTFDLATGPQPTEEDLPDLLTRGLAGIVAERYLYAHRGVSARPVRLGRDTREARAGVKGYPKERQRELLAAAEQHAGQLLMVPEHWRAVDVLAHALLAAESLSGSEVWHLLTQTLDRSSGQASSLPRP